ncbi:MAG TPA: hypothetical protein VNH44_02255 [Micropepsaceae bacterium]|nr:hypothetical protein [Micropepsaceae bacterium]
MILSAPVHAQSWGEYTDREQHFTVNFPGDPVVESISYKTEKGTALPAKVYTAKDARGGEYKITVVNYSMAADEAPTAIAEAAKAERAKGDVKYDGLEHQNNMKSQRVSVAMTNGRFLLAEALMDHGRLFIMEADTPPKMPPPSQFQASLQVLDDNGIAIRYKNPGSDERVR